METVPNRSRPGQLALLQAQASGCGRGVPERQSWKHTPATYVICARDLALDPGLQRELATRCADVREWQTSHSPFVGQPNLIVDLLDELLATSVAR